MGGNMSHGLAALEHMRCVFLSQVLGECLMQSILSRSLMDRSPSSLRSREGFPENDFGPGFAQYSLGESKDCPVHRTLAQLLSPAVHMANHVKCPRCLLMEVQLVVPYKT